MHFWERSYLWFGWVLSKCWMEQQLNETPGTNGLNEDNARKNLVESIIVQTNLHKAHRSTYTAQKMKFSIKDFFSKCDQSSFLWIWSHLMKKSLMENFIFLCSGSWLSRVNDLMPVIEIGVKVLDKLSFWTTLQSQGNSFIDFLMNSNSHLD